MIFSAFERTVAFRYLRARRQEGFISVIAWFSLLGIALGVATLIIVMSVMNGFRAELLGRILGLNGHVDMYGVNGPVLQYDALSERLSKLPGVVSVTPIVEGQALVTANGFSTGALVRGIEPRDFRRKPIISDHIVAGTLAAFDEDRVSIGIKLAQRLGLRIGDGITLISPRGRETPFGTMPRSRTYEVAAIFNVEMYEYDSGYVFLPMEAAQAFFEVGDAATALEVMLTDPDKGLDSAVRTLTEQAPPGLRPVTWQQANGSFFNAIIVERNVMFLILTLIIVVAAFNIISSQIMLVKDKTRAIAILRTMGATRGAILRIFLLTGASIGIVGTGLGFILGVLFARNIEAIRQFVQRLSGTELFDSTIYFLSKLPAKLDWNEVITVVVMALVLTFLATLYPAWRAGRLDPVEALRYE